ncbi:SDR family NAD(P)-dependent oxidoreductase [Achromobacter deleyi]|uniref:SDR family NAD(P)-dependent oxidoreductase n=1 Tax=Achromobacter deleyi TaxID=1353891 RepID=UPI001490B0FE|nr:SDR family NAD(P)-dependent oxidoreductase [Achromobacter deleyi]QVQ28294.1 SDR family oxidoreductase [Achromobacter deleyi]
MAIYPELKNRSVAITGAAGGIGSAAARAFHHQGAHVFLLDIDADGLRAMAASLNAEGPSAAHALPVDITDETGVNAAFANIDAAGLGLDVLINCAGGYRKLLTVEELDTEEWDRTVALNLRSVFLSCRASIPLLKRSRAGRIINITSISGRTVHAASSPAYGAAKAGVTQLTRFLAYELGPANITANSIAPLTTLTPRVAALRSEEDVARIAAQVPLRRLAEVDDHVSAMLYLASDGASFVSGVALDVNGGRVML